LADPTAQAQEVLELVNRLRADPEAELPLLLGSSDPDVARALNYFGVDADALAAQWSTLTPAAPLAWSPELMQTAAAHTQAMLDADVQAHQTPGESSLDQRVLDAGYDFSLLGENVFAYSVSPFYAHAAFAIDWGDGPGGMQNPPEHRQNVMNPQFTQVGIAVLQTVPDKTVGPQLVTEDFAMPRVSENPFLLGTVYDDSNNNGRYDAGEGQAGVTVTVTGSAGTFTTETLTAGSYQMQLPLGSYTVTFAGAALPSLQTATVYVGHENVKQDLNLQLLAAAPVPPGGINPPPTPSPPPDEPNTLPMGKLDVVGPTMIAGWAYDADTPADAVTVQISIDGQNQTADADMARPDLMGYLTTINHGYLVSIPPLSPGLHRVVVTAQDTTTGATTELGRGLLGTNHLPFGALDVANSGQVAGWAYDPDEGAAALPIQIAIDGQPVAVGAAGSPRPDLAPIMSTTDHGFVLQMPAAEPGIHTLTVSTFDPTTGETVVLGTRKMTLNQAPIGCLDVVRPGLVAGWAFDADAGAEAIAARIDLDGRPLVTVSAGAARPDLQSYIGSSAHGVMYALPQLAPGMHTINLYALDSASGDETLLGTKTLTVAADAGLPMGSFDVASADGIYGWAADPAHPDVPVMVRVDINGQPGVPLAAEAARPDLLAILPTAAHGFAVAAPPATGSPIHVDVWMMSGNEPVLLGSRTIAGRAPLGSVDILNGTLITGWAALAGSAAPAQVNVSISGQTEQTVDASATRADLAGYLGSTQHGFTVLPRLDPGLYLVRVTALDPLSGRSVILTTRGLLVAWAGR
jgi:hypothetical protein